ncbi:hypothetical protein GCM10028773_03120 [Spirosoma koreense]
MPDDSYYLSLKSIDQQNNLIKFSGFVTIKNWEDKFIAGYKIRDDLIISELTYIS